MRATWGSYFWTILLEWAHILLVGAMIFFFCLWEPLVDIFSFSPLFLRFIFPFLFPLEIICYLLLYIFSYFFFSITYLGTWPILFFTKEIHNCLETNSTCFENKAKATGLYSLCLSREGENCQINQWETIKNTNDLRN